MNDDIQKARVARWLTRINLIVPALVALTAAALVANYYELPIIIEFFAGVGIFTLTYGIGVILWKHTIGFLLAFSIGVWWVYKTRHND